MAKNGQKKKIKKVQKEGKEPKSTNYNFTINPCSLSKPYSLKDLVSSNLFQLFFSPGKLDLRFICFYQRVYFKQLICTGSPFFWVKMPSLIPFPYWSPTLTAVFQVKHRITKYLNSR